MSNQLSPSDEASPSRPPITQRRVILGRREGLGWSGTGERSAQKLLREVQPSVYRVESNGEVGDVRPHGLKKTGGDVPRIPKRKRPWAWRHPSHRRPAAPIAPPLTKMASAPMMISGSMKTLPGGVKPAAKTAGGISAERGVTSPSPFPTKNPPLGFRGPTAGDGLSKF